MSTRRTDLSGSPGPREDGPRSVSGKARKPPANALEAAVARAQRVAKLREAVVAGTYRPDARKVAAAMLRSRSRRALFGGDH